VERFRHLQTLTETAADTLFRDLFQEELED